MPIEIRELIIKAELRDDQKSSGGGSGKLSAQEKESLIQECVNQVMQILADQKVR